MVALPGSTFQRRWRSAGCRAARAVAGGTYRQTSVGVYPVRAAVEAVKYTEDAGGTHLEHRSATERASINGGAVEIANTVAGQERGFPSVRALWPVPPVCVVPYVKPPTPIIPRTKRVECVDARVQLVSGPLKWRGAGEVCDALQAAPAQKRRSNGDQAGCGVYLENRSSPVRARLAWGLAPSVAALNV